MASTVNRNGFAARVFYPAFGLTLGSLRSFLAAGVGSDLLIQGQSEWLQRLLSPQPVHLLRRGKRV
jgi:hypothetical protein